HEDDVSRRLGARCFATNDCDDRCLAGPQWPGGFCTTDCLNDQECTNQAACVTTGSGSVCLFRCLDDADCAFLDPEHPSAWKCKERDTPSGGGAKELVCVGG